MGREVTRRGEGGRGEGREGREREREEKERERNQMERHKISLLSWIFSKPSGESLLLPHMEAVSDQ